MRTHVVVRGHTHEARLAGDRVVEARMLAVATLVAQEAVQVLVVDVAAEAALERVLAAVPANAVPVRYRAVAAGAQHALHQIRRRRGELVWKAANSDVSICTFVPVKQVRLDLVERRELDH